MKQRKGITLVSLVITIIILLILAGIAIKMLIDGTIIKRAIEAGENYTKAEHEELTMLDELSRQMEGNEAPIITVEDNEKWSGIEGKKVTISTKEGFVTKYTLDGTEPGSGNGIEYEGEFVVTNNCEIKAKYTNEMEMFNKVAIEKIAKIDKLKPEVEDIDTQENIIVGSHSIEIKVNAKDANATKTDGCSGVNSYNYHCNRGESGWITDTSYKFDKVYGTLTGVKCDIYVEVKDEAGNVATSNKTERTTTGINGKYTVTAAGTELISGQDKTYWFYKVNNGLAVGFQTTDSSSGWNNCALISDNEAACMVRRNDREDLRATYYKDYLEGR